MIVEEKVYARLIFQNKVFKAKGQAFEDLFTDIMSRANLNFRGVKPQGNIGDRKNDGFDDKSGKYYQVYAPENPELKISQAIKKLYGDFVGLKEYWQDVCKIEEFYFVFNDEYNGSNPTLETELHKLKIDYQLANTGVILCKHLEDILLSLPDDEIIIITGSIPNPNKIGLLPYSVLNECIDYILKYKTYLSYKQTLAVPDFENKIIFNDLNSIVSALLRKASYHIGILEKYFNSNSNFIKQNLRDRFSDMYQASLLKDYGVSISKGDIPNLRFFDILDNCTPKKESVYQDATLVLMAYFFETCDIFEEPI